MRSRRAHCRRFLGWRRAGVMLCVSRSRWVFATLRVDIPPGSHRERRLYPNDGAGSGSGIASVPHPPTRSLTATHHEAGVVAGWQPVTYRQNTPSCCVSVALESAGK